jgi:hypothetical protein
MWKFLSPVVVALTLLPASPSWASPPGDRVIGTVDLEVILGDHGKSFGRLPDGSLRTTTRASDWEGCFIAAGARKSLLDLPIGNEVAERFVDNRGKISGALERLLVGLPERPNEAPFLRVNTLTLTEIMESKGAPKIDFTAIKRTLDVYQNLAGSEQHSSLDFSKAKELQKLASTFTQTAVVPARLELADHARSKEVLKLLATMPGAAR